MADNDEAYTPVPIPRMLGFCYKTGSNSDEKT